MIHARGGGLNPAQAAILDDFIPGDRHFGVAEKEVGPKKLFRDPFLASIDEFGVRGDGLKLGDVLGFNRVTKDDSGSR